MLSGDCISRISFEKAASLSSIVLRSNNLEYFITFTGANVKPRHYIA